MAQLCNAIPATHSQKVRMLAQHDSRESKGTTKETDQICQDCMSAQQIRAITGFTFRIVAIVDFRIQSTMLMMAASFMIAFTVSLRITITPSFIGIMH